MGRRKIDCPDQLTIFPFIFEDPKIEINVSSKDKELYEKIKSYELGLDIKISICKDEFDNNVYYVNHDFLKQNVFQARLYILDTVSKCLLNNSLVYIYTSLGKTYIAILQSISIFKNNPQKKILFLAPTKPLCLQHCDKINEICNGVKAGVLTGATSKKKRLSLWNENNIIVATPQTIISELKKLKADYNVASPDDISLIVFDEVHNLTGKYAYTEIVEFYHSVKFKNQIRILGFTASPDSDTDKLEELRKAFDISYTDVIAKSLYSDDVLPYVYEKKLLPVFLQKRSSVLTDNLTMQLSKAVMLILQKMKSISQSEGIKDYEFYEILKEENIAYKDKDKCWITSLKISELNKLNSGLQEYAKKYPGDQRAYALMKNWGVLGLFNASMIALKKGVIEFNDFLQEKFHEYELLEAKQKSTKKSLLEFIQNPEIQRSKTMLLSHRLWSKDFEDDINWQEVYQDSKLEEIGYIVNRNATSKIIIFASYRNTVKKIIHYIRDRFPNIHVEGFFGQAKKIKSPGMSQKEQQSILSKFRSNEIDILVSTSVGEQGLNFPSVDVVILFEPVSDARRLIQMSGRTGRSRDGKVYVLVYENTGEQMKYYISVNRKKLIEKHIKNYESFSKGF